MEVIKLTVEMKLMEEIQLMVETRQMGEIQLMEEIRPMEETQPMVGIRLILIIQLIHLMEQMVVMVLLNPNLGQIPIAQMGQMSLCHQQEDFKQILMIIQQSLLRQMVPKSVIIKLH